MPSRLYVCYGSLMILAGFKSDSASSHIKATVESAVCFGENEVVSALKANSALELTLWSSSRRFLSDGLLTVFLCGFYILFSFYIYF